MITRTPVFLTACSMVAVNLAESLATIPPNSIQTEGGPFSKNCRSSSSGSYLEGSRKKKPHKPSFGQMEPGLVPAESLTNLYGKANQPVWGLGPVTSNT
jgi:hypothetical protein